MSLFPSDENPGSEEYGKIAQEVVFNVLARSGGFAVASNKDYIDRRYLSIAKGDASDEDEHTDFWIWDPQKEDLLRIDVTVGGSEVVEKKLRMARDFERRTGEKIYLLAFDARDVEEADKGVQYAQKKIFESFLGQMQHQLSA